MTSDSPERLTRITDPALEDALREGPFSAALQLAIANSELTLDRLEYRLRARGHRIGRSTLSYWQQGQRRPERPASMAALASLEEILGLPESALSSLLGPRKPRGRWIGYQGNVVDWSELAAAPAEAIRLALIDTRRAAERVVDVMSTDRVEVDALRRFRRWDAEVLYRARQNNADRVLELYGFDPNIDVSKLRPSGLEGCRIGRSRSQADEFLLAVELLFDRAMSEGTTHLLRYTYDYTAAYIEGVDESPPTEWARGFRRSTPLYVASIRFDPARLPVRCYHTRSARIGSAEQHVEDLLVTPDGGTHLALQNVQPGIHHVRWEWE
jgi:hypothetical protein